MVDFYARAADKLAGHLARSVGWTKESNDYQRMRYSIDAILRNAVTVIMLLLIGFGLNMFLHVLVFLLAFGALRLVSFGVHAPNPIACTAMGVVRTIGGAWLAVWLANTLPARLLWLLMLLIDAFSVYTFWQYAPAETKKRPIPPGQRRRFTALSRVTLAAGIVAQLILLVLAHNAYASTMAIAALAQAINLCPFMFRLLEKPQAS